MNPITHALISWGIANVPNNTTRRQRVLVTLAGIIPDVDGLGMLIDKSVGLFTEDPTRFYHQYHRVLGHNVVWAALVVAGFVILAGPARRLLTAGLVAVTFHMHLVCDVLGARGPPTMFSPKGDIWGIPYFYVPFFGPNIADDPNHPLWWKWEDQWELNAWPNMLITVLIMLFCAYMAVRAKRTILEVINLRLDGAVVNTIRARFGVKEAEASVETAESEAAAEDEAP